MSEEEPGRRPEPPPRGPSTPSTLRFDPFATGLGVFFGVAIPVVVVGYTRPGGANGTIIAVGILVALIVAIAVAGWVAHRAGQVWRGPQL